MKLAEKWIDYGVIGILVLMSIVTLWLFIERMMFYSSVKIEKFDHRDTLDAVLTENLTTISTIGSNAPYVGLLGTVLGIMITFYSMGNVEQIDPKAIMSGLALALKATAMGLVVAIPATIVYNALMRKVDIIITRYDRYVEVIEKREVDA
ncbi:TonB-system energizer ExbB [Sulfurimonas sp.]|uniref:TonB-system energizer ExbB n=1 Tax=Sulfurimonas sp. TaxID=2022749 RepID=UPI003564DC7C